jgi:hypothetical protein
LSPQLPLHRTAGPSYGADAEQTSAANKKKAMRSSWAIGLNKVLAQNVSQEKVKMFGEAFANIQEATGWNVVPHHWQSASVKQLARQRLNVSLHQCSQSTG